MCKSGFSTLLNVRKKAQNKRDCKTNMRCALSSTKSSIKLLVLRKQLSCMSFTLMLVKINGVLLISFDLCNKKLKKIFVCFALDSELFKSATFFD